MKVSNSDGPHYEPLHRFRKWYHGDLQQRTPYSLNDELGKLDFEVHVLAKIFRSSKSTDLESSQPFGMLWTGHLTAT